MGQRRAPLRDLLNIAAGMVRSGEPLTMEALAQRAGVSRSTAHRRTGGRRALLEALAEAGIEAGARARLLAATREAVAARGLVGVSVESLAERAGVSPMTVYRLFGDRESLLRAALADVFPANALQALNTEGGLEETLLAVAVGMIRFAGTCPRADGVDAGAGQRRPGRADAAARHAAGSPDPAEGLLRAPSRRR